MYNYYHIIHKHISYLHIYIIIYNDKPEYILIFYYFTNQCSMIPAFSSVVAVKQKYISLCPKKIFLLKKWIYLRFLLEHTGRTVISFARWITCWKLKSYFKFLSITLTSRNFPSPPLSSTENDKPIPYMYIVKKNTNSVINLYCSVLTAELPAKWVCSILANILIPSRGRNCNIKMQSKIECTWLH